jgi:hypothetical protein
MKDEIEELKTNSKIKTSETRLGTLTVLDII